MPDDLHFLNFQHGQAVCLRKGSSKTIPLTTAALLLATLAASGCSGRHSATAIEAALQQDRAIQRQVADEMGVVETFWSPSSAIKKYVDGLRAIDMSECPEDFQEAYLQHIHAWQRLQIEKGNNEGLAAFLKGYFGDRDSLMQSLKADEAAQKEIAETWFLVERIALKHGASLATASRVTATTK